MTQPVQEPNPNRDISGLGWGERQLARRPAPAVSVGQPGVGFAASITLPVLELAYQSNNLESNVVPTWVIDSTYAFNGYMQTTAQNAYIAWPVILAPKGSTWMPYAVLAKGSDFGEVRVRIASALPVAAGDDGDGLGGAGLFQDVSTATFVTFDTEDCYAAGPAPYPGSGQIFTSFRIMGDDGVLGTAFTGPGGSDFAAYAWDGGSGPHFLELSVPTKNVSSGGYRMRISALGLIRTDWSALF